MHVLPRHHPHHRNHHTSIAPYSLEDYIVLTGYDILFVRYPPGPPNFPMLIDELKG